ncbi:MAG: PIN domain-containing protein [Tumebacillaceae bacterium]
MGSKVETWLDTNIIIYFLRENKEFSPAARQLVADAMEGKITLKVLPLVIAECVFVLMGPQFGRKKQEIALALTSFINLKGIEAEEKSVIEEALSNYSKKGIDFTDAFIAAHARAVTPAHVVTVNLKDFLHLGVRAERPEEVKRT